ncbi:MAG: hypothetical protein ABIH04_01855 [Planctomycetota bacterium]
MDLKARKIFILAILALVPIVIIVSYVSWNLTAPARKRKDDQVRYEKDEATYKRLQKTTEIWWGDKPGTPLVRLKNMVTQLEEHKEDIIEEIELRDNRLESYFLYEGKELVERAGKIYNFISIYNGKVAGAEGLKELPRGIIFMDPKAEIIEIEKELDEGQIPRIKATQKKVWILQRIIYTLLKPAPGDKREPLVKQLLPPLGRDGPPILVKFTESDQEEQDSPDAYPSNADMFFEIPVYFRVLIDERNLQYLMDELRAYTPHNRNDESTIPKGIRESESPDSELKDFARALEEEPFGNPKTGIVFLVKNVKISRYKDAAVVGENPAPLKAEPGSDPPSVIEQPSRLIEVDFYLAALDYNQHRGQKRPK